MKTGQQDKGHLRKDSRGPRYCCTWRVRGGERCHQHRAEAGGGYENCGATAALDRMWLSSGGTGVSAHESQTRGDHVLINLFET